MSVPAVRPIAVPAGEPVQPAQPGLKAVEGADETAAHPSPARILQERLQSSGWAAAGDVEIDEKRWPLYLALPFWIGLSGLMWAAIIVGVLALFHHH
jgi:hypothetical protein